MGYHLATVDDVRSFRPATKYLRVTRKTHGGPIFCWILSSKYTDGETGLIYYGYRYYMPEPGRWISRDPIGVAGGRHNYGFVLNDPTDLADILGEIPVPLGGNGDLLWDLNHKYLPIGHPDLRGAYGRTWVDGAPSAASPPKKIDKVNECCAKVVRGDASLMLVNMYVPTAASIGVYVTGAGYNDVLFHEQKRGSAYLDGFGAIYGPVSGAGFAVTKCNVLCRRKGWEEAASLLSAYVDDQRAEAWSQFYAYELRAQARIGLENQYWGTVDVGGHLLFSGYTRHFMYAPPPTFDDSKVVCPLSDL